MVNLPVLWQLFPSQGANTKREMLSQNGTEAHQTPTYHFFLHHFPSSYREINFTKYEFLFKSSLNKINEPCSLHFSLCKNSDDCQHLTGFLPFNITDITSYWLILNSVLGWLLSFQEARAWSAIPPLILLFYSITVNFNTFNAFF